VKGPEGVKRRSMEVLVKETCEEKEMFRMMTVEVGNVQVELVSG
jgi:hypothetical protein